jgi:glycosyltransferase involved in cell wall biosynthesis
LKLNWFSNAPWAATGYGNQTKLFTPRIKELGHTVSISAFYGLMGGVLNINGIPIYPCAKQPYGQDVIGAHAVNAGAEAIITLMDVWVVQTENITLPWFPWFPIDHEPIPANIAQSLSRATKGITMSHFGQKMAEQAGFETYYVPHGCDTKALKPMDQTEARKRLSIPEDAFVVGMVAANKGFPPRKAFFQQIAAFAALKKKHSDAILYIHTDDGTRGGGESVNLVDYCVVMGLVPGKDVFFCDQYINVIGFDDEYMKTIYNAMDVKMLVSLGEGFGIPILEAQACGTPVIVGDWTAMPELCFSGWKIDKSETEPVWNPFFKSFQWQAHTEAVAERLFMAYEVKGNQKYRSRARDGALAYDADKVTEKYWKPVLEDIEHKLHKIPETKLVKVA